MTERARLHVPAVAIPVEDAAAVRHRARGRVRMVGAVLAGALATMAARGVQLGLDPDPRTLAIAAENRWAAVSTQGPRGLIEDADGNVLAMSVRAPAIFADPYAMKQRGLDVGRIAEQLADVLELPADELARKLSGDGRYVRLHPGVPPDAAAELVRRGLTRSKGVIIEENYKRYYPQGELAAHLLGFVDDRGGITGIERAFDEQLSGASIVSQRRVNRFGAVVESWHHDERAVQGMALQTTLDRFVQRATERELQRTLETFEPVSATAVVVEVATGRILAMATAPTFNPNRLEEGDVLHTRNLAITDAVEPGSVFKPFTLSAAFENGVAHPGEVLETPSPYRVAGISVRDDHPHARLSTTEIIQYSSNVGAVMLAERVGREQFVSNLKAFGFGEPTGITAFGEASGTRHPPRFGPVELATSAYGYGTTATALQLAMAVATIANDGVRMRPLLVTRVVDPTGNVVQAWEPTVVRRAVSSETAEAVARAMRAVFDPGGTAHGARLPGYTAAGKTGTAFKIVDGRYSRTARYTSFIGFAPAEEPQLAMAVIVDEPTKNGRYGGTVAAPVFSRVMAAALERRGVAPDPALLPGATEEAAPPAEPPAYEPVSLAWTGEAWRLPDLAGRPLRDVLSSLSGAGLHLDIEGTGLLAVQRPAPGALLQPGETVTLQFR